MSDTTSNCLALVPYNQTSLTVTEASLASERESLVQAAISTRCRGRFYRLELGKILEDLHTLYCKPGSGSYMRCVEDEIGIPYSTAQDYRREYRESIGLIETRHVEPNATLAAALSKIDSDANDGTPSSVQLAVEVHEQRVAEAEAKTNDPAILRDFNWKFRQVTLAEAETLRAIKKTNGSESVIATLVAAFPQSATITAATASVPNTNSEEEKNDEAIAA